VAINCSALPENLLESELFGHERGSFTGASAQRIGRFEVANDGTIFLDEIGELSRQLQAKLLRVTQDGRFQRVGSNTEIQTNARILAASNRNLEEEVKAGRFREDLFYRLNVIELNIPPLRERREDILPLAHHFVSELTHGRARFSSSVAECLERYSWPGNVRQLRNVIDWLLIMAPGDTAEPVHADMLPNEITAIAPSVVKWDKASEIMTLPLRDAREVFEREYLLAQVTRFGGNISRTASFVGMERSALHRKLKSLGVFGSERALKVGT